MAETERSYIFDFSRVPSFFAHMNVCDDGIGFKLSDMDGETLNYELVICQSGGDNIGDYLDSDGLLDEATIDPQGTLLLSEDCSLKCNIDEYGDMQIRIGAETTFDIGEQNIPLKAIFLRDKATKYVMGYSINMVAFTVTNKVIFDEDVIFWDIVRYQNE